MMGWFCHHLAIHIRLTCNPADIDIIGTELPRNNVFTRDSSLQVVVGIMRRNQPHCQGNQTQRPERERLFSASELNIDQLGGGRERVVTNNRGDHKQRDEYSSPVPGRWCCSDQLLRKKIKNLNFNFVKFLWNFSHLLNLLPTGLYIHTCYFSNLPPPQYAYYSFYEDSK